MQNLTTKPKLIYSDGRQTGSVRDGIYRRTLKANHFLKYPEVSVCVSTDVLDQLQALEVQSLEFKHSETGTRYKCSLEHFLECGRRLNRGYGEQIALPLTGFVTTGRKLQPVEVKQEGKQVQLAFGGWI